ncbi:hypothetical protein SPI_09286 [Niveomyces insectorum RCEF 264]|uniref:HAM1-like N-terminal domain-containing protein n=1 Tax=Niveomyces insectorum RCEF 264 TaxID=1081102 RepID=A0A167M2S9_9HYPO|nr:hypothetical protein SPI_09286 [Niveomyces insectorum RCEF 264]
MPSLCGLCGSSRGRGDDYHDDNDEDLEAAERRPLLAEYGDETERQRRLHEKLHSYQMLRALAQGSMPSTAQIVANVRTLLAADVLTTLHPAHQELSPAGQALVRWTRRWLEQFLVLVQHKNGADQLQDFVWCLARAEVTVDVDDLARRAGRAKATSQAHTTAAFQSLQTVGSLLLTNADFRLFLSDLTDVGRDVFRDSALALSDASREAATNVEQAGGESAHQKQKQKQSASNTAPGGSPEADEALPQARNNMADVAHEATSAATKVAAETAQSVSGKLVDNDDGARDRLLDRLQRAVGKLRQRPDYDESVSVLAALLQRYAAAYVRAAEHAVEEAVEAVREEEEADVAANDEADAALRNFWSFLTGFGDATAWADLQARFQRLLDRSRGDANHRAFDAFLRQAGDTLQALLTDPAFFDHARERVEALQRQARELDLQATVTGRAPLSSSASRPASSPSSPSAALAAAAEQGKAPTTSIREDIDALFAQVRTTAQSVARDEDVAHLVATSGRIADLLWPHGGRDPHAHAEELLTDAVHVFVPLLVQAVQYVPIPRIEIASPAADLLLENLVLEPGRTVHHSSFLPYQLHVQVRNDVDVRKARFGGAAAQLATSATVTLKGLSVAADEVGYVLRLHAAGGGGLLGGSSRSSLCTDSGIASIHLDERGTDVQLDVAVVRGAADTVLALRRVRVRVHRFAYTLRRSKLAWLAYDAGAGTDQTTRVWVGGVQASGRYEGGAGPGVFEGVYAPGSLLRVWNEEAVRAAERIDDYERAGWRNDIFDVPTGNGHTNG